MKLRRTKKIVPFILGHPVYNSRLLYFIKLCPCTNLHSLS